MNTGRKSDLIRFQNLYFSGSMSIITGKLLKVDYEQTDDKAWILVQFSHNSRTESKISITFFPYKREE